MPKTLISLRLRDDLLVRIDGARGESARTAWIAAALERVLSSDGVVAEAAVPSGPARQSGSAGPAAPARASAVRKAKVYSAAQQMAARMDARYGRGNW